MRKGTDGSVNFDTKIDTAGFEKGLDRAAKEHEKTAQEIEKNAQKSADSIDRSSETATQSVRAQVAKLAADYKKAGMDSSDAMKKAWSEIKSDTSASAWEVEKKVSSIPEAAEKSSENLKSAIENVGTSVSNSADGLGDFSSQFDDTMKAGVASVAGLVAAIGGIGAAVMSVGTQSEQAMHQVAASTGLTGNSLKEIQSVVDDVYQDNFGESMDDVANATAETYKQTKLTGDALKTATESAFSMRDVFGYEVQESVRTAKALMDNFGISAEDAYNLMVQGAQNGLDKNGDMLDTLNEYSVHYSQLGYTAEEFFGSLENGSASGAFSVDKVGDAMKEFGIRVKDTSESTKEAFKILGYTAEADAEAQAERIEKISETSAKVEDLEKKLKYARMEQSEFNDETSELTRIKNADAIAAYTEELDEAKGLLENLQQPTETTGKSMSDLQAKFAAGGEAAKSATQELLQQLSQIDDDVTRNQAGVDLFGTMWEDLGEDAIGALMDTQTEISTTKDAMGQLNEVKYDDVKTSIEALKRTAETKLLQPFAKKLMPKLQDGIEWTSEHLEEIVEAAKPIGAAFAVAFATKKISEFGTSAVNTIQSVRKTLSLLNTSNPMGWITIALSTIAVIGTKIHSVNKKAQEKARALSDDTKETISTMEKAQEQLENVQEAYEDWEESRRSSSKDVEDEYRYYEDLYEELQRITDENGKIKQGYEDRADVISGELSEAMGLEIDIVDGQIQKYDDLKTKIEDVMQTKKAEAMISANESAYMEAYSALPEASKAYANAVKERGRAMKDISDIDKELADIENFQAIYASQSYGDEASIQKTEDAWKQFLAKYGEKFDLTGLDSSTGASLLNEIAYNREANREALQKELETFTKDVEETFSTLKNYQAVRANYENLQSAVASGNAEEIERCTQLLANNFLTAEVGTKDSLEQQKEDAYNAWQDLKRLYEDGAEGISQSLVDAAHEAYLITNDELKTFEQNCSSAGKTAAEQYIQVFSDTLNQNVSIATDSVSSLVASLHDSGMSISDLGRELGYNYAAGVADGVTGQSAVAREEAKKYLYQAIVNDGQKEWKIQSPSRVARGMGIYWDQGLAEGIRDASGEAVSASQLLAEGIAAESQVTLNPWNGAKLVEQQAQYTPAGSQPDPQPAVPERTGNGGNWTFPIYLTPNTQVLDTIVITAKDRANAVSGGTEF